MCALTHLLETKGEEWGKKEWTINNNFKITYLKTHLNFNSIITFQKTINTHINNQFKGSMFYTFVDPKHKHRTILNVNKMNFNNNNNNIMKLHQYPQHPPILSQRQNMFGTTKYIYTYIFNQFMLCMR